MSIKKMSTEMLRIKYEQLNKELNECYQFLRAFPTTSPLGRWSIEAKIRRIEKQLNKIKNQIVEGETKDEVVEG